MIALVIILGIGVAISAIIMHTTNNIQIASGVGTVTSVIGALAIRIILNDAYKTLGDKSKKPSPIKIIKDNPTTHSISKSPQPTRITDALVHIDSPNLYTVLWSPEAPDL